MGSARCRAPSRHLVGRGLPAGRFLELLYRRQELGRESVLELR